MSSNTPLSASARRRPTPYPAELRRSAPPKPLTERLAAAWRRYYYSNRTRLVRGFLFLLLGFVAFQGVRFRPFRPAMPYWWDTFMIDLLDGSVLSMGLMGAIMYYFHTQAYNPFFVVWFMGFLDGRLEYGVLVMVCGVVYEISKGNRADKGSGY